jgi:site-specific recombinase XerD
MTELSVLRDSFRRHLRAEGKADRTCRIYMQAVDFYCAWLVEHDREPVLAELNRDGIRDWLGHLSDTKAPGTVQIRWQGMRRFTGWLLDEGEIHELPMKGMSKPEVPESPVPVLSDEDLAALLKACSGKDFRDRRDEAMIRLLLDCGIRVSELCGMKVDEIDLNGGTAMVTGKRGKQRMIYFGARTERALDRYIRMRSKHRWSHLDALFLGERGATTTDGVRERMIVRAKQAGLDERSNPHRFRHTFAHDFLINGGQERDLKRLAGWTSDVMLERYGASAADVRAKEAAKRLRRGDRI